MLNQPTEIRDRILQIWRDPLAWGEALGYSGTPDGRKVFGPFHRAMLDHVHSQPRTSTVVPRGHAKSTVISIIDASHTLLRDPSARVMIACAGLDLAKKLIGEIRDRLNGDLCLAPGYFVPVREVFPWVAPCSIRGRQPSGPTDKLNIDGRTGQGREPSIFAASITSNLAGNHPTHAIIDDPANEQNSRTFAQRQKVISFIEQLEPLMFSPESPINHIGTPWAFHDVIQYLNERPDWDQFRFSIWDGVNPETGERDGQGPGARGGYPLCPSFLTADEIYAKESAVSKQFFAAQYACEPIPAEEALFDDAFVRAITDESLSLSSLPQGPEIVLWDPVGRVEGIQGDRNGILVVRLVTAGALGLTEYPRDRNIFIPIHAHEIAGGSDAAATYIENTLIPQHPNAKSLWIEQVAAQAVLVPWMEERGKISGVKIRGQKIGTKALPLRLQGVQTAGRKGLIRLPPAFPGHDLLCKRLTEFPLGDSDDLLAALALLSQTIERRGLPPGLDSHTPQGFDPLTPWPSTPNAGTGWPS